jgi:hypothetical protein
MDLETLTVNVEMRVMGWLRRHGLLDSDPDEPPTEPVARSALDACLEGSLGLGDLTVLHRPIQSPRREARRSRNEHAPSNAATPTAPRTPEYRINDSGNSKPNAPRRSSTAC